MTKHKVVLVALCLFNSLAIAQERGGAVSREEHEALKKQVEQLVTERTIETERERLLQEHNTREIVDRILSETHEHRKDILAVLLKLSEAKFERLQHALDLRDAGEQLGEQEERWISAVQTIPLKLATGEALSEDEQQVLKEWGLGLWVEPGAEVFYWWLVEKEARSQELAALRGVKVTNEFDIRDELDEVGASFQLSPHETLRVGLWLTRQPSVLILIGLQGTAKRLADGRILTDVALERLRRTDGLERVVSQYANEMRDPLQASKRYLREAQVSESAADHIQKMIEESQALIDSHPSSYA